MPAKTAKALPPPQTVAPGETPKFRILCGTRNCDYFTDLDKAVAFADSLAKEAGRVARVVTIDSHRVCYDTEHGHANFIPGPISRDVIEEALGRAREARKLLDASWTTYFNKKACSDVTTDAAKDAMSALDNLVRLLQHDLADAGPVPAPSSLPAPSSVTVGDYQVVAVNRGKEWMLMDRAQQVNMGPGASTYPTEEAALHAIDCLMATDAALSHGERFWALMGATRRTA